MTYTGVMRYVNVGRFDNDFNGDGYADAIVGAYLFRGGASLDKTADLVMSGNGYFGWSVASAGGVHGGGSPATAALFPGGVIDAGW